MRRDIPGQPSNEYIFSAFGQRASVWDASHGWASREQAYWGSTPVELNNGGAAHYQQQDWAGGPHPDRGVPYISKRCGRERRMISLRDRAGESTVEIESFWAAARRGGLQDRFQFRAEAVSHISSRYGAPNSKSVEEG